jgi:hypothetical protein
MDILHAMHAQIAVPVNIVRRGARVAYVRSRKNPVPICTNHHRRHRNAQQ